MDGAEGSGKVDEERAEAFGATEVGGALDLLPLAFLGDGSLLVELLWRLDL